MRFQVPQFTDVEDKVIGPLTFKQFIYLAGATGAAIVAYSFLPFFLAAPLIVLIGAFGASLAFYKINNRPFIRAVESFLRYIIKSKLYIWKHEPKPLAEREAAAKNAVFMPKLSESKLRDLVWTLDVKENINPVTRSDDDERDGRDETLAESRHIGDSKIGEKIGDPGFVKPKLEGWE